MGKQKKTYILLIAVLLVWGIIGYRIYKAVTPTVPKVQITSKTASFKPIVTTKRDTFSIATDYRDPFLGTYATKKRVFKKSKQKKATPKKNEQKIIFPNIKYKGVISPKSRLDKRFILKINQQTVLFKLLATHKEIQLLEGNAKEIMVAYKGEQKTILLN